MRYLARLSLQYNVHSIDIYMFFIQFVSSEELVRHCNDMDTRLFIMDHTQPVIATI